MAQDLTQFANGQTADANAVNANFNAINTAASAAQATAVAAQATAATAQNAASIAQSSISGLTSAITVTAASIGVDRPVMFPNSQNGRKIVFDDINANQYYGLGISTGALRYHVSNNNGNHAFFAGASPTSANELMRITGTGNVGVGTTSPQGRLHLNGNSSGQPLLRMLGSGFQMKMGSGSGQEWDLYAGQQDFAISRSGIDFPFIIRSDTGGVSINNGGTVTSGFKLEVGGNIRCVNLTQTSSRDLKQDIAPLTGALDSIMRLRSDWRQPTTSTPTLMAKVSR